MPMIKGNRQSLSLIPVVMILLLNIPVVVSADEGVVYKDSRPLKNIFNVEKSDTPAKEEEAKKSYLYDPRGKTDPFKSFIAVRQEEEAKEKKKPRTYLETLDLSQISLSVIVIGPKGKWAMVKDPKGLGHVIEEGTAVGTNGGVVYKIKPGEIIVREEYKDFRGKTQIRDIPKKTPAVR
jgi:type IV pilus assembly protein PilP